MPQDKTEEELQKEAAQKEVSKFRSLEAVANSAGGKILLKALNKDAVAAIDTLISTFKTAPESELRASCAVLRERIMMIRTLKHASHNRKVSVAELEALSTEEPEEDID